MTPEEILHTSTSTTALWLLESLGINSSHPSPQLLLQPVLPCYY